MDSLANGSPFISLQMMRESQRPDREELQNKGLGPSRSRFTTAW